LSFILFIFIFRENGNLFLLNSVSQKKHKVSQRFGFVCSKITPNVFVCFFVRPF
jgi:hypothetical protein